MYSENLTLLFGVIALIFLVWNFTISIRIMNYLKGKGEKVNPALMHVRIFNSAQKYKQYTTGETGKPGKLYGQFIICIILFAIFLLMGIVSVL
jgi:hypothetical protein